MTGRSVSTIFWNNSFHNFVIKFIHNFRTIFWASLFTRFSLFFAIFYTTYLYNKFVTLLNKESKIKIKISFQSYIWIYIIGLLFSLGTYAKFINLPDFLSVIHMCLIISAAPTPPFQITYLTYFKWTNIYETGCEWNKLPILA